VFPFFLTTTADAQFQGRLDCQSLSRPFEKEIGTVEDAARTEVLILSSILCDPGSS
jgi:hypothetical protein